MKVEIKEVENAINWAKSQVVVSVDEEIRVQVVTNMDSKDEESFCGVDLDTGECSINWRKTAFTPETKQRFPIKLELIIESEQDLINLWHFQNQTLDHVNKDVERASITRKATYDDTFFGVLNKLAIQNNLKP